MRVLVIGNNTEDFVGLRAELLNAIKSHGHDLSVCGPIPRKKISYKLLQKMGAKFNKINIKPLSINPFHDLSTIYQMYACIKKVQPDVVLLLTLKPILYASFISHFLGIKYIYSLNSGIGRVFSLRTYKEKFLFRIIKYPLKKAFSYNKKYIFQNYDDINLFAQLGIISKDKAVRVNGTGVDLSLFNYRNNSFENTIKFIMIARLLKEKGVFEYCEAAKITKAKYNDAISFSLAGNFDESSDGISKNELEKHIGNAVSFLGETNDVKPYLESHNIFVLPSFYREGVPRIIMESMAIGMPIITTDSPGCRDTVNGKNGILIKPKNINSLVEAIEEIMSTKNSIINMSQEGRKYVEEKFNIIDVVENMITAMKLN